MKLAQSLCSQIKGDVLRRFENINAERRVNLHLYDETIQFGETVRAFSHEVAIPRNTALVLADLAPHCNWAHPCQWYLYDANTAELYQKIDAFFPPPHLRRGPENIETFHAPVRLIDTQEARVRGRKVISRRFKALASPLGERYAVLYSGASNNRHVNDIEFLYRTLIDIYAFNPKNIHVLNHDGTINYDGGPKPVAKWPGDNTPYRMVVNGQGTRAAFQSTIATLSGQIHPQDLLFIHTNNHGAGPGDGVSDYCLCAYDPANAWVAYYVNDFVADLGALPGFNVLMVMMEQCRSGGFINPIINNTPARLTHVATAVRANDYSLSGVDFDPFAEDWIAGIAGNYPNGNALSQAVDTSGDGRISASEAFTYADAVHHPGDTPTSSETPAGAGVRILDLQPPGQGLPWLSLLLEPPALIVT